MVFTSISTLSFCHERKDCVFLTFCLLTCKTAMPVSISIVLSSPAELLHYDFDLKDLNSTAFSVIVFSLFFYESSFCETQKKILLKINTLSVFLSVFSIADSVPHWLSKYVLLLFHRRKKAKKWWNSVNLLPNWKNSKHLKSTSFQSNSRYCNLQSLMWCVCLNYTTAIYNLLMSLCSPYCYFFYSSSSKSISLWGCWFSFFFFYCFLKWQWQHGTQR